MCKHDPLCMLSCKCHILQSECIFCPLQNDEIDEFEVYSDPLLPHGFVAHTTVKLST